ncbi:MAG: c-type cytochrome [Acidobacteriota bacterium]|nr:c-type cytochrome [Acidobacteriota bacterium]
MSVRRHLAIAAIALFAFASCEREERRFREMPSAAARRNTERLVSLVPGPYTPDVHVQNPYGRNAWAISEGKRLFSWYNCVGCHSNGGGGMGPPLMDSRWIYGSDPEQIYATIVEGRPNGMPSFRGKIPEYQVWQIVAYVQSLSGNVPKDAAGGRGDEMHGHKQEQSVPDLVPEREPARHP